MQCENEVSDGGERGPELHRCTNVAVYRASSRMSANSMLLCADCVGEFLGLNLAPIETVDLKIAAE